MEAEKLNEQELKEVAGAGRKPKMLRVICPECDFEFYTEYSGVLRCPHCYASIPIWQDAGYKVEVVEWEET